MTKSEQMARVGSRNTAPELALRRHLSRRGVRYRLHRENLPGKPDIFIGRLRLAVFVNGCFWHGHNCRRGKRPASNVDFWNAKIGANRARDKRAKRELVELGIECLTLWTCRLHEFDREARRVAELYRKVR